MDKDDVMGAYDEAAEEYANEFFNNETLDAEMSYLNAFLSLVTKRGKILDAGCGPGIETNFIKEMGFEYYGIDINELYKATTADYHDARIGTIPPPGPLWWNSFLALLEMDGGVITELKLYPLTLGREGEQGEILTRLTGIRAEGRPLLAKEETGKRIVDRISQLSEEYGTKIDFTKGIGVIQID